MTHNIPSVANTPEPPPIKNDTVPVWEQVIKDYDKFVIDHLYKEEIIELMIERDKFGRKKYGVPLQIFNGRNPIKEMIQEILDKVAYCKQAIEEGCDVDNNLQDVYEQSFRDLEIVYMILEQQELNKEKEV